MNDEIREFQETMWCTVIIDEATSDPEVRDAVIRDLADET